MHLLATIGTAKMGEFSDLSHTLSGTSRTWQKSSTRRRVA